MLSTYIDDIIQYGSQNNPELSIVIVNFNGGELFVQQIRKLVDLLDVSSEIIIVDNASKDDSTFKAINVVREVITRSDKRIFLRVVKLNKNLGPCLAYNIGVLAARSNVLILMNNDVIPGNIDFLKLITIYRRLKRFKVAGLTVKVLSLADRNVIDTAGTIVDVLLFSQEYGQGMPSDSPEFNKVYHVHSIPLVFSVIDRNVFLESGMLDPLYFAGYEDLDLSLRIQLLGYKLLYIPYFTVYHRRGSTSGRKEFKPTMSYLFARAHMYNLLTYYSIPSALLRITIRLLMTIAYSLISRNPLVIWYSFIKPFTRVMLNAGHFVRRRRWYRSLLGNWQYVFTSLYKGILPLTSLVKSK